MTSRKTRKELKRLFERGRAGFRAAVLWFVFLMIFMSPPFSALAREDVDITARCQIQFPGGPKIRKKIMDGSYSTFWSRYDSRMYRMRVTLPEGISRGGLYFRFYEEPEKLVVLNEEGEIYREEGKGFAHRYVPFASKGQLTVQLWGTKKGFSLSEFSVLSGKEPPEWVQVWEPTPEKADLMIIVAHPDDEFLWTGGAIPYYALEKGKAVVVCYMTCANGLRRSEMLNALWLAGVRSYPVIGKFRDRTAPGIKGSLKMWGGEKKVEGFITELYRKLKPEVVLTHDLKGEYGHYAHIITANAAVKALACAADPGSFSDSAVQYGIWQVPKLYLHLLKENPIVMEWDQPIHAKGGKTAMQVGIEAFKAYRSQQKNYALTPDGPYSPKRFGLYHSTVGEDIYKNDFFENIQQEAIE